MTDNKGGNKSSKEARDKFTDKLSGIIGVSGVCKHLNQTVKLICDDCKEHLVSGSSYDNFIDSLSKNDEAEGVKIPISSTSYTEMICPIMSGSDNQNQCRGSRCMLWNGVGVDIGRKTLGCCSILGIDIGLKTIVEVMCEIFALNEEVFPNGSE